MLTPQQHGDFDRDGFVLGPKILSSAQCERLCEEVERTIRDRDRSDVRQPVLCRNLNGDDASPVWQIVNIHRSSDAFDFTVRSPVFAEAAAQLMGASELRIFHDQVQYKPAQKGGPTPWHQDSVYWPPLMPKHEQLTAWIALDDADIDNGCMSMVPASHRWGDQIRYLHARPKVFDADGFLRVFDEAFEGRPVHPRYAPVPRGHVHFHHALCWHGSHENRSGRPRRAIAVHLMTERTRHSGESGGHPMAPFITAAKDQPITDEVFTKVWPC
jgi:phytanoyl-CoA hydroxylase